MWRWDTSPRPSGLWLTTHLHAAAAFPHTKRLSVPLPPLPSDRTTFILAVTACLIASLIVCLLCPTGHTNQRMLSQIDMVGLAGIGSCHTPKPNEACPGAYVELWTLLPSHVHTHACTRAHKHMQLYMLCSASIHDMHIQCTCCVPHA